MSSPQLKQPILKRTDKELLFIILALMMVGLANLYSATHGKNDIYNQLFFKQTGWYFFGLTLLFVLSFIDYLVWKRLCWFLYIVNVGLLILVPFVGTTIYGAKRWLALGPLHFQPSETMKISIIVLLSHILSQKPGNKPLNFKDLLWPAGILLLPLLLVLNQPDLGTAVVTLAIAGSLILFIGVRKSILISILFISLITLPLAWNFALKDYQKNRILSFISPRKEPQGIAYNSIQSKIAVGSGQLFGKGFLKGTQSQLEFLPERHSDFVYSVLSEEHGFLGSLITLGLFLFLLLKLLSIARESRNRFGSLLCVGGLFYIFFHMLINVGMSVGLLPVVGLPIPFLSYGGSSLLTTFFILGLVSSVSYRRNLFLTQPAFAAKFF